MHLFRNLNFQLHWLIGITAGIVLAFMGLTGGILSFEEEIVRAVNPGVVSVQAAGTRLEPAELLTRARAAAPERRVSSLRIFADPTEAVRVTYAPPKGQKGKGDTHYQNPYSGEMLGQAKGEDTLHFIEDLHRRLAVGEVGKAVTGACALLFVLMLFSGLYLRWPHKMLHWKQWFYINPRLRGRVFLRGLHQTAGTLLLPLYLVSVLSGLYFAYDWYKNGLYALAGVEPPPARGGPPKAGEGKGGKEGDGKKKEAPWDVPAENLAAVWTGFNGSVTAYESVTLRLPEAEGKPVQVLYLDANPTHDRAFGRMDIETASGAVKKHEPYGEKTRGAQFLTTMFPLHSGSYFGMIGRVLMMLAALAMPIFAVTGWMMYLHRRRMRRKAVPAAPLAAADAPTTGRS